MSNVQENIAKVKLLIDEVKDHCMCAKFQDVGGAFIVIYPYGDFPVDGVRVGYLTNGKAWALKKMLEKMEKHWIESFPNYTD